MSPFRPASQFAAGVGGRREKGVSVHGHRPIPRQGVRYEQHFIFSRFVIFYLLPAIYNTYESSVLCNIHGYYTLFLHTAVMCCYSEHCSLHFNS